MADNTKQSPFGFTLDPNRDMEEPDRTLENFVRVQLQGLLDIVVLTSNGKLVNVNGFLWTRDAFARSADEPPHPVPIFPTPEPL